MEIQSRVIEGPPSDHPVWTRILEGYASSGRGGAVLFPVSALRCLDALRSSAPESLLVLAADEGSVRPDAVSSGELRLLGNGTGSPPAFPVNFHAIGEHTVAHGGQAFFASHRPSGLCVAALAWDGAGRDCRATREAFHDAVELFGPAEFFHVTKSLERTASELTSDEMLAHLRLGAWDPTILHVLLPALRERLAGLSPTEMASWRDALERSWSLYYHFDADQGDLAFGIGALLARAGEWKAAVAFFERSGALWGKDGNTIYNLGVCHARLGDRSAALACAEAVLASNPGHERALQLRREVGGPS